jgi:hypothetical protein
MKSSSPLDDKQFNDLEKAILQWFAENYKDENLTAQVKIAKLKERRWTKAGFYIDLDIPVDMALVDVNKLKSQKPLKEGKPIRKGWPIAGPEIKSDDIADGGGALLWGKDGMISSVELYAYGHFFNEEVKKFALSEVATKDDRNPTNVKDKDGNCVICRHPAGPHIIVAYDTKEESERF